MEKLTFKHLKTYLQEMSVPEAHAIHTTEALDRGSERREGRRQIPLAVPPSEREIKEMIEAVKTGTVPGRNKINVELVATAPAQICDVIRKVIKGGLVSNNLPPT